MNTFQQKLICDALDQPEKLTYRERDFVNSLADLPEDKELSEKQNSTLNRIGSKLD